MTFKIVANGSRNKIKKMASINMNNMSKSIRSLSFFFVLMIYFVACGSYLLIRRNTAALL